MFPSKTELEVRDRSFIGGGWAGANGVGVIPFCAPENGWLHKIVQPFLCFCAFQFPFHKKETTLKESTTSQILAGLPASPILMVYGQPLFVWLSRD